MPLTDRETTLLDTIGDNADPAGSPITRQGSLSTSSNAYTDVATWTVAAGNIGDLHEISLIADILASTEFRVAINAVEQFTDRVLRGPLSIPWRGNEMVAGTIVLIQARSPDNSTAVVADASISGTERPV